MSDEAQMTGNAGNEGSPAEEAMGEGMPAALVEAPAEPEVSGEPGKPTFDILDEVIALTQRLQLAEDLLAMQEKFLLTQPDYKHFKMRHKTF